MLRQYIVDQRAAEQFKQSRPARGLCSTLKIQRFELGQTTPTAAKDQRVASFETNTIYNTVAPQTTSNNTPTLYSSNQPPTESPVLPNR